MKSKILKNQKKYIYILLLFVFVINTTLVKSQDATFMKVPYNKLCNSAFIDDYSNKNISFQTMFIGTLSANSASVYPITYGIKTNGKVFVNHRDTSYKALDGSLGSSDNEMPCVVLAIDKNKSDIVFELKKGDLIEVSGLAKKASKSVGKSIFKVLYIEIAGIKKISK